MHFLASLFVLFFAISASAAEQRTTLDEAARDYVQLVLEIGAHEKGYVDAYFGPSRTRFPRILLGQTGRANKNFARGSTSVTARRSYRRQPETTYRQSMRCLTLSETAACSPTESTG